MQLVGVAVDGCDMMTIKYICGVNMCRGEKNRQQSMAEVSPPPKCSPSIGGEHGELGVKLLWGEYNIMQGG